MWSGNRNKKAKQSRVRRQKVETRNGKVKRKFVENKPEVSSSFKEPGDIIIRCTKSQALKANASTFVKVGKILRIKDTKNVHMITPLENSNINNGFYCVPSLQNPKRSI